jgi:zinc/manganese transport system substrate-binding protein
MRKAARADIYLAVGLSLDLWSDGIVRGSRNRDITVIDCSQVVDPLEVPEGPVDASHGDVHPDGNPHYWLDPLNGIAVAGLLATEFAARDPTGAADYRDNAAMFAREIESRLPLWEEKLHGRTFVEYHSAWIYLAERFGADIAGQVEPLPGIPPSARHLATLAQQIQDAGVSVVLRSPYHPNSPLDFLKRETGVRAAVVPSSCDEPSPESYFALFDRVAAVIGLTAPRTSPP